MYFNPIIYFFKSFIRVFTRKFFWVLLILLMIIVGWVLYDKGVFAAYYQPSDITTDINNAIHTAILSCEQYYNITLDFSGDSGYHYQIATYHVGSDYIGVHIAYTKGVWYSNRNGGCYARSSLPTDVYVYQVRIYDPSNIPSSPGYSIHNTNVYDTEGSGFNSFTYCYSDYTFENVFITNLYEYTEPFTEPSFTTTEIDISTWNFTNLEISGGDVPYYTAFPGGTLEDQTTYIELDVEYNHINYIIGNNNEGGLLNQFITIDEDTALWTMSVPSNYLTNYFNVDNGGEIKFTLFVEQQNPFEQYTINTNDITFNLTAEQIAKINGDSDKQIQGTIINQQQQIVDGQQQLQNTITDTTVPADSEFNLPTIEVNDSTANFFDTLFTGIYNAFNTSEDTSISFTIFSKTITINSADFRMLNDSRFTILRNLLESSWYFAIGYMILKDIRHIFDKIKTGNIENAVSNDIKADMV